MPDICGVGLHLSLQDMVLAVCVRSPRHRGNHSCHVRLTWPQRRWIPTGDIQFTVAYSPVYREVGKSKYLAAAMTTAREREKQP